VPAVSCIQVPTEEMVLAIQRSRNRGILSGAKPLGVGSATATSGPEFGVSKGIAGFSLRLGWVGGFGGLESYFDVETSYVVESEIWRQRDGWDDRDYGS